METYIDVLLNADGEKASKVFKKLTDMDLKYHIGEHDFIYDWKKLVTIEEELQFIDNIQQKLKSSGVILKFTSKR